MNTLDADISHQNYQLVDHSSKHLSNLMQGYYPKQQNQIQHAHLALVGWYCFPIQKRVAQSPLPPLLGASFLLLGNFELKISSQSQNRKRKGFPFAN